MSERRDFYRVYRSPTVGQWSFGLELVFKSVYFGGFPKENTGFEDFESKKRVLCVSQGPGEEF